MRVGFLGIDVGTGSVRAGLFDPDGKLLASAKRDIRTWYDAGGIAEQSTTNIWASVTAAVRAALAESGLEARAVAGIGVDATCSLAVVDPKGAPVAVGPSREPERNVIVWMDHRAEDQARRINETGHPVLSYVGGRISPEMQTPKLLWLKENRLEAYRGAGHFFDLSDYLTWRLTGSLVRSACTVTCKWTYLAHEQRWDSSYFEAIGLDDIACDFSRIGTSIAVPGSRLGAGLAPSAASDLGLPRGVPVAAALIDAHAGGIGTMGAQALGSPENTLGYIFGTSACAMTVTRRPAFVPGVWGPYFGAMIPDLWLNEAGQSAAGAAIDYLVAMHPAAAEASACAAMACLDRLTWLEQQIAPDLDALSSVARRASSLHIVPDLNGNRSPFADPAARAVILGLSTDRSLSGLADLYVAAVCAVGYGLRQIINALSQQRTTVDQIVISGGVARSPLVRQLLADATGLRVLLPESPEPVLLGVAMLGATAAGYYPSLVAAMHAMARIAGASQPSEELAAFHDKKAFVFETLQNVERSTRHAFG
jgi:D-ribulokinase